MKMTRTQRLIRIVQLLQAGRSYDVDALAAEMAISRRTVFRDLNVLREAGVVCSYDAESERYGIDRSYYLPPVNLTMEEALALLLVTRKFVNDRVVPNVSAAMTGGMKIESVLPADVRTMCGSLLDGVTVDWHPVSDVDPITDTIARIQAAMADKRRMAMRYDSYADKCEIETMVDPYRILFRNRGWYLIGRSSVHRQARTFKIERIIEMRVLEERFRPDPKFRLEHYFGNAWSMIRGSVRHHVEVHFSSMVAGNVEEVYWHSTQRTRRRTDGSLVFEVDVDGIDEISWWILGYGDQAVVTEPEELRQLILAHARNATRLYTNGEATPAPRD
ncbi:MAG: WYL domain-containing protein [Phycisphaerales bacterium]|nr:WYL domain-containing protein [Phycisphaerales bacterium]